MANSSNSTWTRHLIFARPATPLKARAGLLKSFTGSIHLTSRQSSPSRDSKVEFRQLKTSSNSLWTRSCNVDFYKRWSAWAAHRPNPGARRAAKWTAPAALLLMVIKISRRALPCSTIARDARLPSPGRKSPRRQTKIRGTEAMRKISRAYKCAYHTPTLYLYPLRKSLCPSRPQCIRVTRTHVKS